jgi:hypothetical protein
LLLVAFTAALAVSGGVAASASAVTLRVVPSISGSGSMTGGCAAADRATGAVTACAVQSFSNNSPTLPIVITRFDAAAQALPAGHWHFVRWEGSSACAGSTTPTCTLGTASDLTVSLVAVFRDTTAPTVNQPVVASYSTSVDRTVTLSWSANEPLASAQCVVDGKAAVPCSNANSHTMTLPEGEHTLRVRGTDRSGNGGGALSSQASFRIIDTGLISGPPAFSRIRTPSFVFTSASGLRFDCSLDNAPFAECATKVDGRGSVTLPSQPDGKHTFRVRARDGSEFDRVPVSMTWTVDTIAPTATLDRSSGPGEGALQVINAETFNFTASEPSTFQCRLDGAAFAACAAPVKLEQLKAGGHRFEVRAIDRAGNIGAVAARNWSVVADDDDGDGFNAQIDCNDSDPGIRPGALEIADNAVDENCDGVLGTTPPPPVVVAPPVVVSPNTKPEQILVTLAFFSSAGKKTTKFTTLQVKNVPFGATVNVTCKGKGCPSGLKRKGFTKKNAFGTVSLAKFIKKPLRAGNVITVVVSKPGAIGAVKVMTVRKRKKPLIATRCQPPGAKKPVAC